MATDYKTRGGQEFDRSAFESLMKRKNFYWQSFEPHGPVKGLFDYGHPLATLEAQFLTIWRDHFVRKERMQELKCAMITPYNVFKTSGHVDKFADFMCKDPKTGEILRADHLIKDVLEARLKSDKEARGEKVEETVDDPTKKKKKLKASKGAVKLDDEVRKEYEFLLATLDDYTTFAALSPATRLSLLFPSTSCSRPRLVPLARSLLSCAPRLPRVSSFRSSTCLNTTMVKCRLLLLPLATLSVTSFRPALASFAFANS
jgi:hypothetical protein